MQFSALFTAFVLPILALSNPAPHVGLPVSIPAAVPTPVASLAASAIANLPGSVSIPVAFPTTVPSTGGESSVPTDLIPQLSIPPAILLNNIQAALDILGIVIALLDPSAALPDGVDLPPGQLGGQDINGELVTTMVTLATGLLSLSPGGAAAVGADIPR